MPKSSTISRIIKDLANWFSQQRNCRLVEFNFNVVKTENKVYRKNMYGSF